MGRDTSRYGATSSLVTYMALFASRLCGWWRWYRIGCLGGLSCLCCPQAYSEESLGIIKRQREMCDKLQRDNDVRG